MEPKSSVIDRSRDLARVTNVYRVTLYNIACCYSTLKNTDAAMEAIEEAMYCGFEEFQKVGSQHCRSMSHWEVQTCIMQGAESDTEISNFDTLRWLHSDLAC